MASTLEAGNRLSLSNPTHGCPSNPCPYLLQMPFVPIHSFATMWTERKSGQRKIRINRKTKKWGMVTDSGRKMTWWSISVCVCVCMSLHVFQLTGRRVHCIFTHKSHQALRHCQKYVQMLLLPTVMYSRAGPMIHVDTRAYVYGLLQWRY